MNERTKKILNISVSVVLTILILLILLFTIFSFNTKKNDGIPKIFGKSYLTVTSNSMNIENEEFDFEGFKRGDIIVIDRYNWVQASDKLFKVGDIITFEWQDEKGNLAFNTHRIIEVNENEQYYITQGDVAASLGLSTDPDIEDPHAERVYFHEVVGSYKSTIKWVGNIFLFFQTPTGFLIFIVIPLLGLFIFEIFNFKKVYVAYRNEKKGIINTKETDSDKLKEEIERLKQELAKKNEEK